MQTHMSLVQEAAHVGQEKTPPLSWLDAGELFHYAHMGFFSLFGRLIFKLMVTALTVILIADQCDSHYYNLRLFFNIFFCCALLFATNLF